MAKKKPTEAQAQLQVQLYDLRREPKLRAARGWFLANFHADTPEDLQRVVPLGTRQAERFRMSASYWEMVCQMLENGLLDEDLFFQTCNEPFFYWERLRPTIVLTREFMSNPHLFEYLEKSAARYVKWANRRAPGFVDALRQNSRQFFSRSDANVAARGKSGPKAVGREPRAKS